MENKFSKKKYAAEKEEIILKKDSEMGFKYDKQRNYKYNEEESNPNKDTATHIISENKINILDFRMFDIVTFSSDIIVCIHHSNPDANILKLFCEIESKIILTEKTPKDGFISDHDVLIDLESYEDDLILFELFKKCINNYKTKALTSKKEKLKIIFYVDFKYCDLCMFFIFNFFKKCEEFDNFYSIIFIYEGSIVCPLNSGLNKIYLSKSLFTKKGIGLLPIRKSIISTKGLKWDVSQWETEFASKNLSTSNETDNEEFSVIVEEGNIFLALEIDYNNIQFL